MGDKALSTATRGLGSTIALQLTARIISFGLKVTCARLLGPQRFAYSEVCPFFLTRTSLSKSPRVTDVQTENEVDNCAHNLRSCSTLSGPTLSPPLCRTPSSSGRISTDLHPRKGQGSIPTPRHVWNALLRGACDLHRRDLLGVLLQ